MHKAGLTLKNLTVFAKGKQLLAIDRHVRPSEVLTVMGPSGCGKSSLLNVIIGAQPDGISYSGQVLVNGRDVTNLPTEQRRIGILFQDPLLFPHMTVGENLAFGLARGAGRRRERAKQADQALSQIGLQGFTSRDPASLSGGQRTRVALMRVLLSAPDVLLLDEPFAKLDHKLRGKMRQMVFDFARDLPVVMVTHDPADAEAAGGPVLEF